MKFNELFIVENFLAMVEMWQFRQYSQQILKKKLKKNEDKFWKFELNPNIYPKSNIIYSSSDTLYQKFLKLY